MLIIQLILFLGDNIGWTNTAFGSVVLMLVSLGLLALSVVSAGVSFLGSRLFGWQVRYDRRQVMMLLFSGALGLAWLFQYVTERETERTAALALRDAAVVGYEYQLNDKGEWHVESSLPLDPSG